MSEGTLKIHTENILPIIKKWLYSDKEIFVRELIANSCDAISKLKIIQSGTSGDFRIDLNIDKDAKTLKFSDTGIGMTHEEVEKYIAQVAFSGAEEFIDKYKAESEQDPIIGHFGLGFYSSYMVADKVEIQTLSYQEGAESVFWSCDGSPSYIIDKGNRTERGTEITLFVGADSEEFLEETRIHEILTHYCAFLPYPIYLNGTLINSKAPLWIKAPSECTDEEYIEFYHQLYPFDPEPLFWVHLNIDYPFHLKGILYFPKIHQRFDWTKSQIKLFCNRVFVSDNCREILPDYLSILRGALDSPDIPLNVSRSYLQMDRNVRQLATHITKKVAQRLSTLYQTEKEKFLSYWKDIETIVKLGCLQDEKFYEKSKEFLVWQNLKGDWTTIEDYLQRHAEKHPDKVFYSSDNKQTLSLLDLYKGQGIEVLCMGTPVDTALLGFLEDKLRPVKFQRIDGALDASIIDSSREKTLLDSDGKTEGVKIADFFRSHLQKDNLQIETKSLAADNVSAFLLIDEDLRRMRDYMAFSGQTLPPSLTGKRTLVLNSNNKLISSILSLPNQKLAQEMVEYVYELALLGQNEKDAEALPNFLSRTSTLMESLIAEKGN